jgi:hypothetical protein
MLSLSSKSILLSLGPKNHMLSQHWLNRPFSEASRECVLMRPFAFEMYLEMNGVAARPRHHGCKLRMAVPLTKNMTTKLAACSIEAMRLLAGGVGPVALFLERDCCRAESDLLLSFSNESNMRGTSLLATCLPRHFYKISNCTPFGRVVSKVHCVECR